MIEVCVGQHDNVDVGRLDRQVLPVPFAQLFESLKQSRIDQHPRAVRFDQVFRSGDRTSRTQERHFDHRASPPALGPGLTSTLGSAQPHPNNLREQGHLSARVPEHHPVACSVPARIRAIRPAMAFAV